MFAVGYVAAREVSSPTYSQVFLSPSQQQATRSRVSIDLGGGLRCSSDGGNTPTLALSVGAYPDLLVNGAPGITETLTSAGSQSSLFSVLSFSFPLGQTNQNFDCTPLLTEGRLRARLQSLRELVDDDIITEAEYKKAVLKSYKDILGITLGSKLDLGAPGSLTVK